MSDDPSAADADRTAVTPVDAGSSDDAASADEETLPRRPIEPEGVVLEHAALVCLGVALTLAVVTGVV